MGALKTGNGGWLRPLVAVVLCGGMWSTAMAPAAAAPAKQAVTTPSKPAARRAPARPVARRTAATVTASRNSGKRRVAQQAAAPRARATPVRVARTSATPRPAARSTAPRVHAAVDRLGLNAAAVLVLDQDTGEELYAKNADAVLPIASLTKLMTGLVLISAGLPLDERISISNADVDRLKGSSSRLPVGTTLSRGEMMHLALMSSENRAAHALGRTYPGGMDRFVRLMNAHAQLLGMNHTRYVEPTGLSSGNRSSARDLARLVATAGEQTLLRRLTTSLSHDVNLGRRVIPYRNTNALMWDPAWDINLQKTGYIREAGRCLVMQTEMDGRRLIMVFLDSDSGQSRIADAKRVRQWVAMGHASENYALSN